MIKTVLFVGSDPNYNRDVFTPSGAAHIDIRRERSVLQTVYRIQRYFRFVYLDHCTWDELHSAVLEHRPSILHICSHGVQIGDEARLLFVDDDARTLEVGAELFIQTMDDCRPLELVFLDACRSALLAKSICARQSRYFCIGYDSDVPVSASTRGSGYFHTEIASGRGVEKATENLRTLLSSIPKWEKANPKCHRHPSQKDRQIRAFPRILAKFYKDDPTVDSSGAYKINFGLDLCDQGRPTRDEDLYLVCFFSDERDYIAQEYVTLIKNLRANAPFWHHDAGRECWDYDNDADVYCTVVHLRTGFAETVSCKASQALRRYYESTWCKDPRFEEAVLALEKL